MITLFEESLELLLLTVEALDAEADFFDISSLAFAFFTARLDLAVLLFTVALFIDSELVEASSLSESFSSSMLTIDLAVPTLRYLFCVI